MKNNSVNQEAAILLKSVNESIYQILMLEVFEEL